MLHIVHIFQDASEKRSTILHLKEPFLTFTSNAAASAKALGGTFFKSTRGTYMFLLAVVTYKHY